MSIAYVPPQKNRPPPSPAQIQKMLDENSQLIQGIVDYQSKGKAAECLQYQQILHRNLVYLASIADAVPGILPPPPIPGNVNSIQQQQQQQQPPPQVSESSPQISSPSVNQGVAQQQVNATSQMTTSPSPRGNVTAAPGAPMGNVQGSMSVSGTTSPHTAYSMNMSSQGQQQPTSATNSMGQVSAHPSGTMASHPSQQAQQPQQQQPQQQQQQQQLSSQQQQLPHSPQGTHQNVGNYSRSMTPQQYGSMPGSQQYSQNSYSSAQNQPPHPPYNTSTPPQSGFQGSNTAANFSNESSQNYQAPVTQAQNYNSAPTAQPQSQPPASSQQQQQQQQQQQTSQSQGYPNATTSQASTYNQQTTTTSQAYTTQTSQAYAPQTQSYAQSSSNTQSQWYQSQNSQSYSAATSQQSNYPSASIAQGYGSQMSHNMNFSSQSSQSNYGSPPTTTAQPSNFGTPAASQAGYVHHSPSPASQESTPPPGPIQPNRFSSNYGHSSYMHYRPSSQPTQAHANMGSSMGPPSSNIHRQSAPTNTAQGQSYNYDQAQNYQSYQSQ